MKKWFHLIFCILSGLGLIGFIENETILSFYQKIFLLFYFVIVIVFLFYQGKNKSVKKPEKKDKVLIAGISMIVVIFGRNIWIPVQYQDCEIEITATGEKNKESNSYEVWIQEIEINHNLVDLSKYQNEQWIFLDHCIVSNAGEEKEILLIPIEKMESVKITFGKHAWSGIAEVNFLGNQNKIDLFSHSGGIAEVVLDGISKKENMIFYTAKLIGWYFIIYFVLLFVYLKVFHKVNKSLANIIAFIHWIVSFKTDSFIFLYSADQQNRVFLFKLIFLVLLLFFWNMVIWFYKKVKERSGKEVKFLKYAAIHFGINFLILLLIWPGNWIWDEYAILNAARGLQIDIWQHYLTSLFYIFSLMLLPFPGGILIVQNLVISFLTAGTLLLIENHIKNKKWIWFMFLPLFLPPVLRQNYYPIRLSLYAYIELFFGFYFIFEKEKILGSLKRMLLFSFLIAVLAVWRTEGCLVLAWVLLYFWYWGIKKQECRTNVKYLTCFLLVSFFLIKLPQNIIQSRANQVSYQLTAYIESLDDLVKEEFSKNPESEILNELNEFLDIEILLGSSTGESAFWNGVARENLDSSSLKKISMVFLRLLKRYPNVFIKERIDTFLCTAGGKNNSDTIVTNSANMFEDTREAVIYFREHYFINRPVSIKLREHILNLINGIYPNSYSDTAFMPCYYIFYNVIPCLIIMFLFFFYCIMKRNKKYLFVLVIYFSQFFIVMLTAPGKYFMYYFPIYLFGNVLIVYLIEKAGSRKGKGYERF